VLVESPEHEREYSRSELVGFRKHRWIGDVAHAHSEEQLAGGRAMPRADV